MEVRLTEALARAAGSETLQVDADTGAGALVALTETPALRDALRDGIWAFRVDGRRVERPAWESLMTRPCRRLEVQNGARYRDGGATLWWYLGATVLTTAAAVALAPRIEDYSQREDPEDRQRFLYAGPVNSVEEGGPVPLAYGRIRVGSTVVSAGISVSVDGNRGGGGDGPGGGAGNPNDDPYGRVEAMVRSGYDDDPREPPEPPPDPSDTDDYTWVSLEGNASVRIVDLLCEGEIHGFTRDGTNPWQHVFLDGTPVLDQAGNRNASGLINVEMLRGADGENVDRIFRSYNEVETETAVDAKLGTDYTSRAVAGSPDAVRVTVRVPALWYRESSRDDLQGNSIKFVVQTKKGAKVTGTYRYQVAGKYLSSREASVRIPFASDDTSIQVKRVSAQSTDETLERDELRWKSYTAIQSLELSYPHSAVVGVTFNAQTSGDRIPLREYEILARKVQLPTGYNPWTRAYGAGVWDGTFKANDEWTENPAWIVYHYLRRAKRPASDDLTPGLRDAAYRARHDFHELARWCDEDVAGPTVEPRWSWGLCLARPLEVKEVNAALLGPIRAQLHDGGRELAITIDKPADPVAVVGTPNVLDGEFLYSTRVGWNDRVSVVAVSFSDPDDGYRQSVELVVADDLVEKYGYKRLDIAAMGCTRRGQAHRIGRATLYEQEYENEQVEFRATWDNALLRPGDIIRLADRDATVARLARRIARKPVPQAGFICLDEAIPADLLARISAVTVRRVKAETKGTAPWTAADRAPGVHRLTAADGVVFETKPNDNTCLSIRKADGANVLRNYPTQFVEGVVILELSNPDEKPRLFRVSDVTEIDALEFAVTATLHDPDKWTVVESARSIAPPDRRRTGPLKPPKSVTASEVGYVLPTDEPATEIVVEVEPDGEDPRQRTLEIQVRSAPRQTAIPAKLPWERLTLGPARSHTIRPATPGAWEFRARWLGGGTRSTWRKIAAVLQADGVDDPPAATTGLTAVPERGGYVAEWTLPTEADWVGTAIWDQPSGSAATTTPWTDDTCVFRGLVRGTQLRVWLTGGDYQERRVYASTRDRWGNYAPPATVIVVPTRPDSVQIIEDEMWRLMPDDSTSIPDPNKLWDNSWVRWPIQVTSTKKRVVRAFRQAHIGPDGANYLRWATEEWSHWDGTLAPRKAVRFFRTAHSAATTLGALVPDTPKYNYIDGVYRPYRLGRVINRTTAAIGTDIMGAAVSGNMTFGDVEYDPYPPAGTGPALPYLAFTQFTDVAGIGAGRLEGFPKAFYQVAVVTDEIIGVWSDPQMWARWGARGVGQSLVLFGAEARALELLGVSVVISPPEGPTGGGSKVWGKWVYKGVVSSSNHPPWLYFAGSSTDLLNLPLDRLYEVDIRSGQANKPSGVSVGDLFLGMRVQKAGSSDWHTVLADYDEESAYYDRGNADTDWTTVPLPAWLNAQAVEFDSLRPTSDTHWIQTANGLIKWWLNANDIPQGCITNWGAIWAGLVGGVRKRQMVSLVGDDTLGWWESTYSVQSQSAAFGASVAPPAPAEECCRYIRVASADEMPERPDWDDGPVDDETEWGVTNGWSEKPPKATKALPTLMRTHWRPEFPAAPWSRPVVVRG